MSTTEKKKLLILCPYPFDHAPSQRLKFEQYYPEFRADGWDITIRPFISADFWKVVYKKGHYFAKTLFTIKAYLRRFADLFTLSKYDAVYVHLWVTPFGPPIFEWMVEKLSRHLVYDIDDMIYLKETKSKATPFISNLKGKNKPLFLFKHADHVITCTSFLEEYARKFTEFVTDIPVSIDTERYQPKTDYSVKEDKIVLGWSGSITTAPMMHLLDDMLKELAKEVDFKLVIIGDGTYSIEGVDVESMDWKKEYEMATLQRFDIGLYPLPNDPWVYGKGGGKALQYMSLGIPTVATGLGANLQIITDGESGFLVNTKEEWIARLKELIASKELRERIGKAGVRRIDERYSVHANKEKYIHILNKD